MGTVYPIGDDRWRGSVFIRDADGKRVRRYVSGATEAAVIDKLRTAQEDADKAAAVAASPTLAWWATRWLAAVQIRVRGSTHRSYEAMMRRHVLPVLGDRRLVELRAADVETMVARLVGGGLSPNTAALARRVLVACLSDAERDERIPRNVARSSRPPRVEPKDRRRLTTDEVRHLLALAAVDPRTDLLVHLALGTGARVGELCALDWSDIDLEAGTMTVRGTLSRVGIVGPPKSRRSRRVVALPGFTLNALRRELERRLGATGPILTGAAPGGRVTIQRTGEWWRALRDRAGIGSDVRFHDLRGTAATFALAAGVTPTEVARSLGHDPAVLMRTYAGAIPGGRELVADAIGRAIDG